ncbi:cytosine-5--methyltransferase [Irpex rosettiformis]|uniref:Cytosine-5--methyltransferase n=1 Tax=Irpex rosettiformis TaxID=378272 RepID=A0ACB8U1U7_9APHY|nr:cytosine-5--methyltransferase [Irpex rosettiformis]
MARGKGKGRRGGKTPQNRDTYKVDIIEKEDMHNEKFEKYYKAQKILPECEWESFMESMRGPLPTTFRVTGSRQTAALLNETIQETHVPHLAGVVFEGEPVAPPKQISWYPDGLAWQLNVEKKVLRKSPEFKKFHNFLVFETEVGNISRQEAVSMLPPLFLEVQPHHRVIDMCAAPGSKTAQLLEALHAHDTITASSFPSGLLIANDSDNKRTHMLIHQSSRLPSPALMVTNHDASIYPAIKIPSEQIAFPSGTKTRVISKKQHQLLFDRILCDVPCSGDGTLRKNLGIWKSWTPMDGNGLHGLQLRILQRAMRMLKKGGRIVYSTCSLNPVENEAVVAAALKSIPDFQLADMSNHLPSLQFRPGMTTWTPSVDRSVVVDYSTYHDFIQSLPESKRADSKLLQSYWPPPPDEAESLRLTRCMRIYPHLQDTGGFFVAVLERKPSPVRVQPHSPNGPIVEGKRVAEPIEELDMTEQKKLKLDPEVGRATPTTESDLIEIDDAAADDSVAPPSEENVTELPTTEMTTPSAEDTPTSKKRGSAKTKGSDIHFKENPYTFLSPDDPVLQACILQLNLSQDFPATNMLVRNPTGDTIRSVWLTNDIVRQIIENNDYTRMRLMTAGSKVMAKQEGAAAKRDGAASQFRILSEGLPAMLPYIKPETILTADVVSLKILMENYYPVLSGFPGPFRSAIEPKAAGCIIVKFEKSQIEGSSLAHDLVLPIWKSNVSITLMIEKKAKSALSSRVFGEDITTAAREAAQKKRDTLAISESAGQGAEEIISTGTPPDGGEPAEPTKDV